MVIQTYKPEFIFNFKNEIIISENINKQFILIAKNMKSSTDAKTFKVKISQDVKLNTNKWHRKRFTSDIEKTKKKINSNLNMYSKLNFKDITENILKLKITTEEQLDYLINSIIDKFRSDHHSDVWNYLLEKLIFSNINKWKFNNKYVVERILDIIHQEFKNIVITDYQKTLEDYINNNIEDFYKIKYKNYGLMKIIAELFKYNLVDKNIITKNLEYLTLDINRQYDLELGVILVTSLFKYISLEEKNKFIDYFSIFLKNPLLDKKVYFMILDIIDDKIDEQPVIVDNNTEYFTDEQIETCIKSNINDYKDDVNLEEFLVNITNMKIPVKSNKLIYYWVLYILDNPDDIDIAMMLLSSCISKKIIKFNTLKYGLIEFLNDYDSFKWDYPKLDTIIKDIIKIFKKNTFLTFDNLKFIFSKINGDIKTKFI